jgi:leucyl-tRNA synthetase
MAEKAEKYDFEKIENRWKDKWYEDNVCEAVNFSEKPKKYILAELPYPSGYALHAGHMMRYTVPEIYSRYLRMNGYNVLYPMGWDAFGLPAETFAIETGTHPAETTEKAIENFRESLVRMGYGFDWKREFSTADPENYKWTQWMFLKLWEKGLARLEETPVWWCEELKTVLAEEEVLTGKDGNKISERKEHPVERKMVKQWVLKIPEYAEKLLDGLEEVDFTDAIKTAQRNWIGKSVGATVNFSIDGEDIPVFTTRPDTLFGATFLVLAPEHPLLDTLIKKAMNKEEVVGYVNKAKNLSDVERQTNKDKAGVRLEGVAAKSPLKEIDSDVPVFVAEYVLMGYGTGAIMAVPAHDDRDFEFAKKHGLEIIEVIESGGKVEGECYVGQGKMINSGEYNGTDSEKFSETITERLEKEGRGKKDIHYKIRDQIFSRQRYWGEPIPLVHKKDGTVEAVDEKELPLVLPEVPDYTPSSDGSSPLAKNKEWVNVKDSEGNPAKRETDTMPTWAGSNWYYVRYLDPKNDKEFADPKILKYWMPVDRYFGGAEHTTMHLLYSRFWYRFLHDEDLVPTKEPYQWRLNGGMLLGADGRKMSKSYGNVIDPIDAVKKYGADATRMFVCFIGPYTDTYPWNPNGIKACHRLVREVYEMRNKVGSGDTKELQTAYHKMVKNVTGMCEDLKMNTAISQFMIFVNLAKKEKSISKDLWIGFLRLLAPFAPFISEELWQEVNGFKQWKKENSVHLQEWPKYDENFLVEKTVVIPVQINGKVRENIELDPIASEEEAKKEALASEKVQKYVEGKEIKKVIYVTGKILNFVV